MSKEIFRHRWLACYENEQGIPYLWMPSGVLAVPITSEREIVFITELSPAYGERVLFLPGGGIEPGEDPAESANRELQEEAGFKAGRLERLGRLHPLVKYLQAHLTVFLARDLEISKLTGDERWEVGVERIPLAALFMAQKFLMNETL